MSAPDRLGRHRLPQRTRLYEIDALRITAAVAVMIYHYVFSGPVGGSSPLRFAAADEVARFGYLGVDLFFVISGFVVLLNAWDRRPRAFLVSRIVRLYPAFWVAVTITALVSVTLGMGRYPVTFVQYLANLTMLNSLPDIPDIDVVYWTLWAEIRFYVLIFALSWIGVTLGRVTAMLWGWLALTFLLQSGVLPAPVHGLADLVVQSQFSHYFIAGMALCAIHRYGMSWQPGLIVAICLGNAVHRGIEFAGKVGSRYHTDIAAGVVVAVIVAIFVAMTLVALRVTHRLGRPWFAVAGALTYPLYLVHAHVGFILFTRLGDLAQPHLLLIGVMALMGLLAYAIHTLVERPLAPALKRLLSAREAPRPG
ncbi:acyltransferase family protein [Nonomuraea phyllanthi]|uniref:acyltransferase family protein n=1 Tax=Nonomuraea phyllanthi TaxID=2219224 RepID=UPI00129325A5|nr:acyltransferase [Nonomuraea phyllanthi]QFY13104.1 acyltransferase family protein [Nonomuraea phyllanthi]